MRSIIIPTLVLIAATAGTPPAMAAWPNSAYTNLPVCTAAFDQLNPVLISDGAGGAILAWNDSRSGSYDIYVQHILAAGITDPAWPVNGRGLCTFAGNQLTPTLVSDGAGGAIVTWQDLRSGFYDIYVQHVLASGIADPAWPADGRALCTAADDQLTPILVADGSGGAIVAWNDDRVGWASQDVYAQHVLAAGTVDPAWPVDGRALCTASGIQTASRIASDGAGGAVVTWQDARLGLGTDIYAGRVLASGVADPAWTIDGRLVCGAAGGQYNPTIIPDGAAGWIVAWQDIRNASNHDVYVQHLSSAGIPDLAWPVNGRALCTAAGNQYSPTPVSDGAGGAIVTWFDFRSASNYDIYAHHVLASGIADPAWPVDGRGLCLASGDQQYPAIVADGAGGAVVVWADARTGTDDIYAQHLLATGLADPAWPVDGRVMSAAPGTQRYPVIASDGAGGAIATWQDFRTASSYDVHAQRIARFGYLGTPEAEITGVHDVPNDQGGRVRLSWTASYLDLAQDANLAAYDVYRSVPPNVASAARAGGALRILREGDLATPRPGEIVTLPAGATTNAWEYVQSVSPNHFASEYSVLAPTAFDSISGSNPRTAFLVLARNNSGSMFWPSRPDSGYSVDNLPPAPPAPFAGSYSAGSASLQWGANAEPDLAYYRLYRGATPGFTPGALTWVANLTARSYVDAPGSPNYYKLSAVDRNGNESGYAALLPAGTAGVADGTAVAFALTGVTPNPAAGGRCHVAFALPDGAPATLELLDVAGRRIARAEVGTLGAGRHVVDLAPAGRVAPGLYLVRLTQGARIATARIMVLK